MTLNHKIIAFRRSDSARAELAVLLNNPTLKAAFAAVLEAGVPREIPKMDARNHPDTDISHHFYRMVGINSVLEMLDKMTYPLEDIAADHDVEEPFAHSLPVHLRSPLETHKKQR